MLKSAAPALERGEGTKHLPVIYGNREIPRCAQSDDFDFASFAPLRFTSEE